MRIAVMADIPGNMPALEAVLADIDRRKIDRTINLVDCVSGHSDPARSVVCWFGADGRMIARGVVKVVPRLISPTDRRGLDCLNIQTHSGEP